MTIGYWIGTGIRVLGASALLVVVFMRTHWSVGFLLGYLVVSEEIRTVSEDLQEKLDELRAEKARRVAQ